MSEEQAQALLQQMQALEAYMADLIQKEEAVIKLLQEASGAIESMASLNEEGLLETLVPVGMGTYVKATIQPQEKIIVNIGAGAAIEQDKAAAINYVEQRIKELEVALQQISSQRQEMALRLEQGQQEMNRLIQEHRTPKQ
ncbi:MAG TPA: prefoldin subunit alpha [Nitrosopumilaceae archaeon]|nr:prefoldin subunit alpha [Nitrosopumilaceae archaeon]